MKTIKSSLSFYYILIFLLVCCACGSPDDSTHISLLPFRESDGGDWGFMDTEGKVVIKPVYQTQPSIFQEGYALLRDSGQFYFLDEEGKRSENGYKHATLFHEGLAAVVRDNEKITYLDDDLEAILTLENAEQAGIFAEGLARFQNTEGLWGFVNKKGKTVIEPRYEQANNFSEGLAVVIERDKKGIYWGVIDKEGNKVVRPSDQYQEIKAFSEGLAAFKEEGSWGFINKQGEKVIKAQWDEMTSFMNGYASYLDGEEWGALDKNGEKVIRARYGFPLQFFNGMALVPSEAMEKVGFINTESEMVIEPVYNNIALPFLTGNAIVADGSYFIFVNKEGEMINKNG